MAFTTAMTGTTEVDNSAILAFDQQFILAAAELGIMDQFVTYKKQIGAESIDLTKYAQIALATTPLDEDDDVASVALSDSQILITPQEYGSVVTTTALANLKSGGKVDLAAARLVGINMGRTLDKLAILQAEASANELFPTGVASEAALVAADVMDADLLDRLYNKLARANVAPLQDGMYVLVMHDDVIFDLRNATSAGSWFDVAKYENSVSIFKNEVAMFKGFRIVRDNLVTVNADAGAALVDSYHSLALGFNALGKAVSQDAQLVISGPFDKLQRFANMGWKSCLNYKIVDQDALWIGTTASSVGVNI